MCSEHLKVSGSRLSYLQSRNRDIEIENNHMDPKGEREGWDELEDWD